MKPTMTELGGVTAACLSLALMGCNVLTGSEDVDTDGEPISGEVVEGGGSKAPVPGPTKAVSCAYAPATTGIKQGEQLPAFLKWEGHLAGAPAAEAATLFATSMYDCEGSKGIHAIVFDTSQFG